MECLLPYLRKVTVPHIMVGLERMLDYRGVGLERFHCTHGFKVHTPGVLLLFCTRKHVKVDGICSRINTTAVL